MSAKHTPTPRLRDKYRLVIGDDNIGNSDLTYGSIRNVDTNMHVARVWNDNPTHIEEAEYLVECANSHAALIEQNRALREILGMIINSPKTSVFPNGNAILYAKKDTLDQARAALALPEIK